MTPRCRRSCSWQPAVPVYARVLRPQILGGVRRRRDRVVPEFQDHWVGETIAYGPNVMRLERVEPGHVMAMLRGIKERAGTLASEGA
jgi:hypothetical protein